MANGNNKIVLLEMSNSKENIEIVHWHFVDEHVFNKIRRQAKREDGQLLILPSDSDSEEVGALSDPTQGLSSDGKNSDYNRDEKEEKEKNKSYNKLQDDEDNQALAVDVNSVPSIYPRDNVLGILDWINKDLQQVAVDETKLSAALTNSSPIPLTLPKQLIALMMLQR